MSVTEIVNIFSSLLDVSAEINIYNQAKAEIPTQYLDGSKIKNVIGWEPKTVFKEAIKETFAWYKHILR